ncbi:hypothetical protein F511_07431 [Dorcoceras hygrometricum]|uniref:Uncharacterized protein n=1 Tax=Dorcoceras hygrometricum TaxID=472368 RepID=A0A2Z7B0V7_9LAMI|nr:hypothetical protein F511_07431 [Dorcoceras hygrometricum]
MMNSRRICPADGSYKDSAVGLVFMESAAGLAMETSKVESAVRNQTRAKLNQLKHNKSAGTITTSCKRLRAKCYLEIAIAKRCRLHKLIRQRFALALKIQQMLFALKIQQSQDTSWKHMFNTSWTTRRKQQQHPVVPSKHDDVKLVYVVSHTVAAGVHFWSLGVLTAAGCGIGSVHEFLAKIEYQFMFWAETKLVSKFFELRMLVLYKLYEMEVMKRVDEHHANFNPAEPSDNYDNMCIRIIDRELKRILDIEHRAHEEEQPAPEDKETAMTEQPAQEQIEKISRVVETVDETEAEREAVNSQEHQAQE